MVKKMFIIKFNPASLLTSLGLAIALAANIIVLNAPPRGEAGAESFYLSMGLIYLGMLADALDGYLARKNNWESEFGKYLDGFTDVFLYLVFPNLALRYIGFSGLSAHFASFVMIFCGILRLAFFNIDGNVVTKGKASYRGLPVFWSLLVLPVLCLLHHFFPAGISNFFTAMVWVTIGFLNITDRAFPKPQSARLMSVILLGLSFLYFWLYLKGES